MKPFFDSVRAQFGKLKQRQVECLTALHDATLGMALEHRAYILATAWHETWCFAHMREIWGPTAQQLKYEPPHAIAQRLGNTLKGDGRKFMGRGFVQLTGRRNYAWAGKITGKDLLAMPELAEMPEIAARILVDGMASGAFTGKRLADFKTYEAMRRAVNGTDKAALIAGHARKFEKALRT